MQLLLPDIWSIIFLEAAVKRYEDMPPPSLPHGRFPPWRVQFAISAVCRSWREMCRGDSRIWRYATICFVEEGPYVSDLGVHCSLTRGQLDTLIIIRPCDLDLLFDGITSFKNDLERIRKLKAVDFSFRGNDIGRPNLRDLSPFDALLRSPAMSQIDTLVVRHLNERISAYFRFTPQPSLRHFECHQTSILVDSSVTKIDSLRHHWYASVDTVLKSITFMAKHLRVLDLQLATSVWKNSSVERLSKTDLPVLEVIRTPYRVLVEIFDDFFDAPNVHTHEILDMKPSDGKSLSFPSSIRRSVQHISLPNTKKIDATNANRLLSVYPELKTLTAHGSIAVPILDAIILAVERSQPPTFEPLPAYITSLETITLDTLHTSNADGELIFSRVKKIKTDLGPSSPTVVIGVDVTVLTVTEKRGLMT